ncbi:MAG TPA: hypothetical protein VFS64_06240 [Solirubrobacterales bacterium]|nr:hypothetical protein [Solirubrobacterales bacterium]
MRAAPLAILVLAAALLFGCGGSGETSTSRPAEVGSSARDVRPGWERKPDCRHPAGASRWSCSVGPYRCQGVVTDRGWSVDCAKPGRSVAFTVRRG